MLWYSFRSTDQQLVILYQQLQGFNTSTTPGFRLVSLDPFPRVSGVRSGHGTRHGTKMSWMVWNKMKDKQGVTRESIQGSPVPIDDCKGWWLFGSSFSVVGPLTTQASEAASSQGHPQILSPSRGEKSGEGLGSLLRHEPEMVGSVSTSMGAR